MVKANYIVFIVGIAALAVMYMTALFMKVDGEAVLSILSGLIGLMAGIMIPAPKSTKKGVLKW